MIGIYSLRSAEEEIEVAKLEAHPLAPPSDELIAADEVLGIGARIRGREDVAGALVVGVDRERARQTRRRRADLVLGYTAARGGSSTQKGKIRAGATRSVKHGLN